jgi:hypothetical protein
VACGLWCITSQKEFLTDYRTFEVAEKVGLRNGRVVEALGIGNVPLRMLFKVSSSKRAVLHNVLCVPKLACSLFAAASNGNSVKFNDWGCWIRRKSGELQGVGSLVGKLYQLD